MAKKSFNINRVNTLPSSGKNGDQYFLRKPNGRYEQWMVVPNGSLEMLKGITDAEQSRVDRLTSSQLTKLEGLKTQAEIDSKINQAIAGEKGSIGLSDVPPTEDGIYRAKESGTYTNLGGLVVESGKSVWFLKSGSMWSIYSTIDGAPATGIVESGNTGATSGNEVYKNIQPLRTSLQKDVTSDMIKETKLLGVYSATELEIVSITSGILFSIKMNQGDQFNITRPSVQSNRFRVLTSTKSTVPTVGDLLLNMYNDSSNTKLTYDGIMPVTGWLCVFLDNRLGTDPTKPSLESVQLYITKTVNVNSELSNIKQGYMDKDEYLSIEYTPTSNNLFNKDAPLNNKDVIDGVLTDRSGVIMSNPIPVKKDDVYTTSGKTISIVGRNLYFFNNADDTIVRGSILGGSGVSQTFTSPINGVMRTLSKDLSFDWRDTMQVNKGSTALPYEPWSPPIEKDVINPNYLPEINATTSIEPRAFELDLSRGSLDVSGKFPTFSLDRVWRDNEFKNNLRTLKYVNIDSNSNTSIELVDDSILSAYNIFIYQFDSSFNLVSRTLINSKNTPIQNGTRYCKFYVNKKDSSEISVIPRIKISASFIGSIYTKNSADSSNTIKFVCQTQRVKNGRDMVDMSHSSEPYQFNTTESYTHGILRLPSTYSPNGEPIRLICFAHGSADWRVDEFGYLNYVQYLVDEGYAVWDAFAWSNDYPDGNQYMGSPTNNSCYNAVYDFIVKNYNVLDDGTHLFGKSHGGLQVLGLPYCTSIPFRSAVSLAGAINSMSFSLGYINADRIATARDFGIEGDLTPLLGTTSNDANAQAFLKLHADKFIGYNPLFCGSINFNPQDMVVNSFSEYDSMNLTVWSKVPTKCYISPSDSVSLVKGNQLRQRAVNRGGGIFELRYMPTTGNVTDAHHTVDTFGPFIPSITTKLGIVHSNVPVAYAEMLQFFKRFE